MLLNNISLAELPNLLKLLPASHRVFISLRADIVVAKGQSDVTVTGPLQADSKSGEEKSHYPVHTNHGTPSSAKQDRQDGHLRSAPPWEAPGSAEGL